MGLADFATVKKSDAANFPGPGQYSVRSSIGGGSGRVATFKHRHKESPRGAATSEGVGPGSYQVPGTIGREGPKFSMSGPLTKGSAAASQQTDLGPAYSPRQYTMSACPGSPRYTIAGRYQTGGRPDSDTLGPAAFSLPSTLAKQGITLGLKRESSMSATNTNPGPGQYAVRRFGDDLPSPRRVAEGHTVAPEYVAKPAPGPGAYEVNQHCIATKAAPQPLDAARKHPLFGSKCRPPESAPRIGPGPAAYDPPSDFSPSVGSARRGRTIGARPAESSELESIYPRPGPGEYKIPSCFESAGKKGFSLASRIPEPRSRLQVPGPGQYNPSQLALAEEVAKSPRGVRFNAHHHFNDGAPVPLRSPRVDTQAPGPGAYEAKPIVPRPPTFVMTSRDSRGGIFADTTNAPGPGAYTIDDPHLSTAAPSGFTFFKGAFSPPSAPAAIGPGAYDLHGSYEATKPKRGTCFALHNPPPSPRRAEQTMLPGSAR